MYRNLVNEIVSSPKFGGIADLRKYAPQIREHSIGLILNRFSVTAVLGLQHAKDG